MKMTIEMEESHLCGFLRESAETVLIADFASDWECHPDDMMYAFDYIRAVNAVLGHFGETPIDIAKRIAEIKKSQS